MYYIETGCKFKFVQNDSSRVTIECIKKKNTGCKWRIYASTMLKMNGSSWLRRLKIITLVVLHAKISENHCFTSKLIKKLIHGEVWDKPFVKLKDIIERFRKNYGRQLSYYYTYTGKELTLKEIYGDDSLSYHHLISYIEQLRESNPNSYVVLEIYLENHKFSRLFIVLMLAFESFTSAVLCYFWMEPL